MAEPTIEALLEELWAPIAALTAAADGRANGLITSTAVTASLLPEAPRVTVVLSRASVTRELAIAAGAFALHLLPAEPREPSVEIFRRLGFTSGSDEDKLASIRWRTGSTGAPILEEALCFVEGRVASTHDAGDITIVLADVVAGERLRDGRHLTIEDVRAQLTDEDLTTWEARRAEELARARELR